MNEKPGKEKFKKRFVAALASGCAAFLPSCRQVSKLQSAINNRRLPLAKRIGLRLHLLVCSWCRRYGKRIRFLREAVHEHPAEFDAPAGAVLSPEARERLKQTLRRGAK